MIENKIKIIKNKRNSIEHQNSFYLNIIYMCRINKYNKKCTNLYKNKIYNRNSWKQEINHTKIDARLRDFVASRSIQLRASTNRSHIPRVVEAGCSLLSLAFQSLSCKKNSLSLFVLKQNIFVCCSVLFVY